MRNTTDELFFRYECAVCGEVMPCSIVAIRKHCKDSHQLGLNDYAVYARYRGHLFVLKHETHQTVLVFRYARKLSACLWDAERGEYVSTFFENLTRYTCQLCVKPNQDKAEPPKSFFSLDAVRAHARRLHPERY